jgi:tRNA(fMet)-specific endonuclease VapC
MIYLLDTDISSYYLRGRYNLNVIFEQKGVDNLRLSIVTVAEMKVLAHKNPQSAINIHSINTFSQSLGILHVDQNTWEIYSMMKAEIQRRGRIRGDLDILNASIAKQHNLIMVTNNVSHYQDVIQVENWIEN